MNKYTLYALLGVLLTAAPVFAHHAAEGIVDDDIYASIDEMVADTPHATMELTDMGGDTTEITVSTGTVRSLENMIDDGLLDLAAMLDGEVTMLIELDDQAGATATITQVE